MSANRLLGLRCKGTTKFADVQIFKVKSVKCRVYGVEAGDTRRMNAER